MVDVKELQPDQSGADWRDDLQRIDAGMPAGGPKPPLAAASSGLDALAGPCLVTARRPTEPAGRRFRSDAPPAEVRDALRLMALEDLLFPEVTGPRWGTPCASRTGTRPVST